MIHYEIDTTENDYKTIQGDIDDINELKKLIFPNEVFTDCVGYLYTDAAPDSSLCIAAVKEYGVFLGHNSNNTLTISLSLSDREQLSEVVDVWGDDLNVSQGLFISPELAWEGICEFAASGNLHKAIEWIGTDEIPEEGNYIN